MLSSEEASSSSSSSCFKRTKIHGGREGEGNDLCSTGGGGGGGGEIDRIGKLPDHILTHILSFIPTIEAVRTHVLSKRWSYVWTSVPCINIWDGLLLSRNYYILRGTREVKTCFVNFVHRVLRLNTLPCFRKVFLSCDYDGFGDSDYDAFDDFSRLINTVTVRDIEELVLKHDGWCIELPCRVFTSSRKLVILRLYEDFVLNVPASVCLPNLKILVLYHVNIPSEDSMNDLLAGCPVLEELELYIGLYSKSLTAYYIRSSSLKSLILIASHSLKNSKLVLDAKNLMRLQLTDALIGQFDMSSLSSLVSVNLNLYPRHITSSVEADIHTELLKKMCNTKYLRLSTLTMEGLELAPLNNLPIFHYLTHLKVDLHNSSWPVLPYLLECSPNLIIFELNKKTTCNKPYKVGYPMPKYLESVSIRTMHWSHNEMEMVSYFLRNGTVLKKISIDLGRLGPKWLNLKELFTKEIFTLPKASNSCELEVFSDNEKLISLS